MADPPKGLSVFADLKNQLEDIVASAHAYQHPVSKPPIIDACFEDRVDDIQHVESVPGLRSFKDSVRKDLDVLTKYLENPDLASAPPSTNALYLIAVWKVVISVPWPVVGINQAFETVKGKPSPRSRIKRSVISVKVDIVANGGKDWIRVNTIKNSRMLAELREIDSYCTDSEDDADVGRPSLAPTEFDNSLLRAARALLDAAAHHPLPDGTIPQVTFRLTRLDPAPSSPRDHDPRIAQTISGLQEIGITVSLGDLPRFAFTPAPSPSGVDALLAPTRHINLDLSILVALVSDLTHATLPSSAEEAEAWFTPGERYREWKEARIRAGKAKPPGYAAESAKGRVSQTRALATQAMQEVRNGMLHEIATRVDVAGHAHDVEFWTTEEARDRCMRIVAKIGGPNERRRAQALFEPEGDVQAAAEAYWKDSRWPSDMLSLHPIQIFPPSANVSLPQDGHPPGTFFRMLQQTCRALLADEPVPDARTSADPGPDADNASEIGRAAVTSVNSKLTAHTVQSMLCGAARGWTTLTANRGSVRTVLKETRSRNVGLGLVPELERDSQDPAGQSAPAGFWVVEPRSLAEGMRPEAEL